MLMQTRDGYVTGRASAAIRTAGLSVTMPRLAVWMILEQAQAPLLVVDIERALLNSGIRVPLSSVYAALKRLSGSGVVAVHMFNDGKAHYALASRRFRQRIVCTQTGLEHWPQNQELANAIETFCRSQGFALQDYTLSVQATRVEGERSP